MTNKKNGKKQHPPKPKKQFTKRVATVAKAMGRINLGKRKSDTHASARELAYFLMNPSGSPAIRLASPYDGSPSSVVTLHNQISFTLPTIVGSYDTAGIHTTTGLFHSFYFRDPLRSMVCFNPNQAAYKYMASFSGSVTSPNGYGSATIPQKATDIFRITPLYYSWVSGATVHGTVLFCGMDTESGIEGYAWLDYGATLIASQNTANTGDSLSVYSYYGGRDVLLITTSFLATGKVSFTLDVTVTACDPTHGAYVRIEYLTGTTPSASQALGVTIGNTSASDVFSHYSIPGASTHLSDFSMARVNSASLLLQNCAAPMYREGTLQAASFDEGSSWNELVGLQNLGTLANSRNAYRGQLAKGSYSYLHISERTDLEYRSYVRYDRQSGAIQNCSFPLNKCRFVAVTAVTSLVGPSFPGYDFFLQHTSCLEFQTQDQWYNARVSTMPSSEVFVALDLVKLETQFFCNPNHLAQIGQFISGAGRMVKRHAGKLGGALSVLFPGYSAVFRTLANAIQS